MKNEREKVHQGRKGDCKGNMDQGGGPAGYCVCPKCGYKKPHERGVRCLEERCPQCGGKLVREGSLHHKKILEKQRENK